MMFCRYAGCTENVDIMFPLVMGPAMLVALAFIWWLLFGFKWPRD